MCIRDRRKTEDRRRSRLAAASSKADRIRREIARLIRHASEPAVGGARKIGRAPGDLLEGAAGAVADDAGGAMHVAGSVVDEASLAAAKPATPRRRRGTPRRR